MTLGNFTSNNLFKQKLRVFLFNVLNGKNVLNFYGAFFTMIIYLQYEIIVRCFMYVIFLIKFFNQIFKNLDYPLFANSLENNKEVSK